MTEPDRFAALKEAVRSAGLINEEVQNHPQLDADYMAAKTRGMLLIFAQALLLAENNDLALAAIAAEVKASRRKVATELRMRRRYEHEAVTTERAREALRSVDDLGDVL